MEITVEATPNFALTKYWGKSDVRKKKTHAPVPATPSIGITVSGISSICRITLGDPLLQDTLKVDGANLSSEEMRDSGLIISALRQLTGFTESVHIDSFNSFPTAAGAASSSSGMAAIAFGLAHLLKVFDATLSLTELAQIGSVSAARATHGGFVYLPAESSTEAHQLFPEDYWKELRILLCITSRERKVISSRAAMQLSQTTSPIFPTWKEHAERDTKEIITAIRTRDFERLGTISERNALLMHATTMTSSPSVLFWNPGTLAVIQTIHELRRAGIHAYCTMDAGPQVKVLYESFNESQILDRLKDTPLLLESIPLRVGCGPRIIRTQ